MTGVSKILAVGAVAFLIGCTATLPPLPPAQDLSYRLASGDEVRVITYGADNLTAQFRVSDGGTIAMPLIGNVRAVGLTPDELGTEIGREFVKKQLLVKPSVSVEIVTYRAIYVLGEVTRPGQYPYQPGMTVVQSVAMAGGYTYRAQTKTATIVRSQGNESNPIEGSALQNAVIQPGDVVNIPESLF